MLMSRLSILIAIILLASCGGGGGGGNESGGGDNGGDRTPSGSQNNSPTIEGRVVDGPLSGAKVFLDLNGNLIQDANEVSVFSDANGFFEFPANTEASAFLHILVTQKECLFTHVPIPATPSETSEDSDHSGPQQMDVDASEPDPEGASDEIPEGANQIRFLQRHNAMMMHSFEDTVTQSPLPWAGHVE